MSDLLFPDLYRPNVVDISAKSSPVVTPAPFRGKTARAAHASYTGATYVAAMFDSRVAKVLNALQQRSMSRQELRDHTELEINAVCSVVGHLLKQQRIEVVLGDWNVHVWPDGRTTRRERLGLKK